MAPLLSDLDMSVANSAPLPTPTRHGSVDPGLGDRAATLGVLIADADPASHTFLYSR